MSLVAIAEPQSESELSVMLSLLDANGIPAYVHNGGFGGLVPGPRINTYNLRRVMVPSACADEAHEILSVLAQPVESSVSPSETSFRDKLRMIFEFFFLGWFVPGRWRPRNSKRVGASARRVGGGRWST